MKSSYRDLEIYQEALAGFYKTHALSLLLPKFEMYELGSQLRRSADSVATNIAEGYGRRKYKSEFIRYLTFSHSSSLETLSHLEKIIVLYPAHLDKSSALKEKYEILSKRIYQFLVYVESNWRV
jgi:four helix bundle protein